MTNEYIRREDAVMQLSHNKRRGDDEWELAVASDMEIIKTLPPADVVPVVHSQWKYKCGEIQCPECGNRIHRIDLSGCLNFCPNCGAKMDGEE